MSSSGTQEKDIPQIMREDLDHISPLHRFCAEELIRAGLLAVVEPESKTNG